MTGLWRSSSVSSGDFRSYGVQRVHCIAFRVQPTVSEPDTVIPLNAANLNLAAVGRKPSIHRAYRVLSAKSARAQSGTIKEEDNYSKAKI